MVPPPFFYWGTELSAHGGSVAGGLGGYPALSVRDHCGGDSSASSRQFYRAIKKSINMYLIYLDLSRADPVPLASTAPPPPSVSRIKERRREEEEKNLI